MQPTVTDPDRLPVIVGAAQVTHRGDHNREPIDLLAEAAEMALHDARVPAGGELASVDVVQVVSWIYDDPPRRLGERIGRSARRMAVSPIGGDQPTRRLAAAGRRAAADGGLHLIAGGEAMRSVARAMASGEVARWTPPPPGARPLDPLDFVGEEAALHGLALPPAVYPLYEHGLRAHLGQRRSEAQAWSAELWGQLSVTAAQQAGAWFREPVTPERIRTVDAGNRMVYDPYPKLLNALLSVDQAAAVVVTDVAGARRLGLPADDLVYLWNEAGARDTGDVLDRVAYHRAPAMERVLTDVLVTAGVGSDREALSAAEVYSCFPCVPKLALDHLGWDRHAPISVAGGLTFFGGPGNAYMLAACAVMTAVLRGCDDARPALLYGQGEFVTKHHALVVGRRPRPAGALPPDGEPARQRAVDGETGPGRARFPEGPATVETFTIEYTRDGRPSRAVVVGRLDGGGRFVAHDAGAGDLAELLDDSVEPIGRPGLAAPGSEREPNRFVLK